MKKIALPVIILFLFSSCNKETDSESENTNQNTSNIKWKIFKVSSKVDCNNPSNIQPFTEYYINFWTLSGGNQEPNSSFTPKPNTWYKVTSNLFLKTDSDIKPIDDRSGAYVSFSAETASYDQPCK